MIGRYLLRVFCVLTAGIPLSAMEILSEACKKAYGEVNIEELTKDNVRQRVRLASKDANTVLVVVDAVCEEICRDACTETISSDKYYCYNTDRDLVLYLNNKLGTDLELPEEEEDLVAEENISRVSDEEYEQLKLQISSLVSINKNLKNQVAELKDSLEREDNFTDSREAEELREEVSSLKENLESSIQDSLSAKNQLLESENNCKQANERISELEKSLSSLSGNNRSLESKISTMRSDYESVSQELADYKVKYSTQSGVIRAKDSEISSLRRQIDLIERNQKDVDDAKKQVSIFKEETSDYKRQLSELKIELSSKEEEIIRLSDEVKAKGIESDMVNTLKRNIEDLTSERDNLLKRVSNLEELLESSKSETQTARISISELQQKLDDATTKASENDDALVTLNKENIELKNKVSVLEMSSNRDESIESVYEELTDLRKKYDSMMRSVFSQIASTALPRSASAIHLTRSGVNLKNIRFVFSGNAESRKGTYRSLLNEFKSYKSSDKVLIVDVVSETSIDYVFEIKRVIAGLDWFRRGGSVQPYLSDTCLRNVQVLSPGLTYINDSYFLTVDWEARLSELERSGYKVVLYCGDISNIVGRVLHESFASLGSSWVYVQGNAIGSRTVITNLKGLSNSSKSIVAYYDYNKQMDRFYRLVQRTNECRILSLVGGYQ
jgi:myosin heavy subunit